MSGNTKKYIDKLKRDKSYLYMRLEELTEAAKLFASATQEQQDRGIVEVSEDSLDNLDEAIAVYGYEHINDSMEK